jgi:hypothetical protein
MKAIEPPRIQHVVAAGVPVVYLVSSEYPISTGPGYRACVLERKVVGDECDTP